MHKNELRRVVEALVLDEHNGWSWSDTAQLVEHAIGGLDADKGHGRKLCRAQRGRTVRLQPGW